MKGQDIKKQNSDHMMKKPNELHKLDHDLKTLSQGVYLKPSDEFTNRVMQGISTPVLFQIYWLKTPFRAAVAILLLVTFIGLNAFSLKSISNYADTSTQSFEQEFTEIEFTMEDLGWLSTNYPQIVMEE